MKYFRFRNWHTKQHYKSRAPIWIKMETGLRSYPTDNWFDLTDAQRGQFMGLQMLAAKMDNAVPYDDEFVKEEIMASGAVELSVFAGEIEVYGSRRECLLADQGERISAGKEPGAPKCASKPASKPDSKTENKPASNHASKPDSEVSSGLASIEGEEEEDQSKRKNKRGRTPEPAVGNTTKGPSLPSAAVESPSESPNELNIQNQKNQESGEPTPDQARMLATMARERGLDVEEVARECGVAWPIRAVSAGDVQNWVSAVKKEIIRLGDLSKTGQKAYKKRMEFQRHWDRIEANIDDPDRTAREIETVAETEPKVAIVLLSRVVDWIRENSQDGVGGSGIVASWDTLENLSAAYRSAGVSREYDGEKEFGHAVQL